MEETLLDSPEPSGQALEVTGEGIGTELRIIILGVVNVRDVRSDELFLCKGKMVSLRKCP